MFVNPPVRETSPAKHIPQGIAMLTAVAHNWGADVAVEDVNLYRNSLEQCRQDFRDAVKRDKIPFDIIAVSGLVTTYGWQRDFLKAIREDWPGSLLIAGGGCASALHTKFLDWCPELDAVAYGEGEVTLVQMLELAKRGRLHAALQEVGNLHYRDDLEKWGGLPDKPNQRRRKVKHLLEGRTRKKHRAYHSTKANQLLTEEQLGALPYPKYDVFQLNVENVPGISPQFPGYYARSGLDLSLYAQHSQRRLDVIDERGCPGKCIYCSHCLMGGDYLREDHCGLYGDQVVETPEGPRLKPLVRYFPMDWTIGLIKHLRMKYRIDFFANMSETFLWNRDRAFEFCDALEDEDLLYDDLYWGCLGRVENIDYGLARRLSDCHCTYVSMGFESSYQPHLDYIRKGSNPAMQGAALKQLAQAGVNPVCTYIIGYPGESMKGLYETCKFWVENEVVRIEPFFLTPYVYTPLYWENIDRIRDQWPDEEAFVVACGDAYDFVVNLTEKFTDAELRGLKRMMMDMDLEGLRLHSRWRVEKGFDEPDELVVDPDPPRTGHRRVEEVNA